MTARPRQPREARREHPQVRPALRRRDQPASRPTRPRKWPRCERHCAGLGVHGRARREPFSDGGSGCVELAEVVRDLVARDRAADSSRSTTGTTRSSTRSRRSPARCTARRPWTTRRARRRDLEQLEKAGFDKLPVCIAKTQQSLSDNPALLGRPKDFLVTVREIQLAAGAGFIIPITGEILRMPGLPKVPMSQPVRPVGRRRGAVLAALSGCLRAAALSLVTAARYGRHRSRDRSEGRRLHRPLRRP